MITVTHFPTLYITQGTPYDLTWSSLFHRLSTATQCASRASLGGWSPAVYQDNSRAEGKRALSVGALVIEHDNADPATGERVANPVTLCETVERWSEFYGCIYTTFSHTPEWPRYRIVVALDRRVTPGEYALIWKWAQRRDPMIDSRASDAKRFWFLPATRPDRVFESRQLTGAFVEVDTVLREIPSIETTPAAPRGVRQCVEGDVVFRARAYLSRVPGAVSGAGGHAATFSVARALVTGFALDPDTALDLLAEWNQSCEPPWKEKDLRRKIEQAANSASKLPLGYLLNAPRRCA